VFMLGMSGNAYSCGGALTVRWGELVDGSRGTATHFCIGYFGGNGVSEMQEDIEEFIEILNNDADTPLALSFIRSLINSDIPVDLPRQLSSVNNLLIMPRMFHLLALLL
jgi:hypothetical protein